MFKSINGGQLPQRATKYSAGFDVFANEDVVIGAGQTKVIGLGICLDDEYLHKNVDVWAGHSYRLQANGLADDNHNKFLSEQHQKNYNHFASILYFMLCLRSSLGAKGLILPNGHGVIDIDYKDEIKMIIHNPINSADYMSAGEVEWGHKFIIKRGDKIGQLILNRHAGGLLPTEYTKDEERNGGFGSTDQ